jgi:hypothetical protein
LRPPKSECAIAALLNRRHKIRKPRDVDDRAILRDKESIVPGND